MEETYHDHPEMGLGTFEVMCDVDELHGGNSLKLVDLVFLRRLLALLFVFAFSTPIQFESSSPDLFEDPLVFVQEIHLLRHSQRLTGSES